MVTVISWFLFFIGLAAAVSAVFLKPDESPKQTLTANGLFFGGIVFLGTGLFLGSKGLLEIFGILVCLGYAVATAVATVRFLLRDDQERRMMKTRLSRFFGRFNLFHKKVTYVGGQKRRRRRHS